MENKKSFNVNDFTQEELLKMELEGHGIVVTDKHIEMAMEEVERGLTTAEAVREVLTTFKATAEEKSETSTYQVRVVWTQFAYVEIEAESKEAAIAKAMENPIPDDSSYLDDSVSVTHCSQPNGDLYGDEQDLV